MRRPSPDTLLVCDYEPDDAVDIRASIDRSADTSMDENVIAAIMDSDVARTRREP